MNKAIVLPAWKQKGSRFYIPLYKRPWKLFRNKFWYMKYKHYWINLFLYGWKQCLPSDPKVGDSAGCDHGVGGKISQITDDYIEVRGIYVYPSGDDKPSWDYEHWSYRYDRRKLGRLWRRSFGRRNQWEFKGKPYHSSHQ